MILYIFKVILEVLSTTTNSNTTWRDKEAFLLLNSSKIILTQKKTPENFRMLSWISGSPTVKVKVKVT